MALTSIIIPTTGRRDRAVACISNLIATTKNQDVEIIVVVDADRESFTALSRALRGVKHRLDYSDTYRGNKAAWNRGLELSAGDYIVFGADDLVWGENWLPAALDVMRARFGSEGGLVGFNDGHWDGAILSTHYIMSRQFIVEVLGGCIAWDWYKHSFNDLEVNDRAKAAGRFAWAKEAQVTHQHWTYGDRPMDDTDSRWLGHYEAARSMYELRKSLGFPVNYPAVIGPRKGKKRIGWLADAADSYRGGAEMVSDELQAQAPGWAEITYLPPEGVTEGFDAYVVHNCVSYGEEIVRVIQDKPVIKMIHDVWPHGDFNLRRWLLNTATLIFVSPLQLQTFKYAVNKQAVVYVPANVYTLPYKQAAQAAQNRSGAIWLGRLFPGKGVEAAIAWAEANQTPLDFYGYGPLVEAVAGQYARYCGRVAPDDTPALLARYERFVFLPTEVDTYSRTTVEAYVAGCKLTINGNVGAAYWIKEEPQAIHEGAARFWKVVEGAING